MRLYLLRPPMIKARKLAERKLTKEEHAEIVKGIQIEAAFLNDKLGLTEKAKVFRFKECTSCLIVREPGVVHCIECDHCVRSYDHHCGITGNCVTERSIPNFIGLLNWTFILTISYFLSFLAF